MSLKSILIHPHLTDVHKTSLEIRRLVESMVKARTNALPPPKFPRIDLPPPSNQESQDEYGGFDLDINDPALIAALGEDLSTNTEDLRNLDEELCKVPSSTQFVQTNASSTSRLLGLQTYPGCCGGRFTSLLRLLPKPTSMLEAGKSTPGSSVG